MKKYNTIIILILLLSNSVWSQVVFQPIEDEVYTFLERMAVKGIIKFNSEALPISRKKISEYLNEIDVNKDKLSKVDIADLDWYKKEYFTELGIEGKERRWFLYAYQDSSFDFKFSPLAGYQLNSTAGEKGHKRWWGVRSFATVGDNFGMSIDFRDVGEFGNNLDTRKLFTPERGYAFGNSAPNGFEYSDIRGALNLSWKWGSVSLRKDYNLWGHGQFGKLIISDKPHSYPHIRLDINPVEWLRFYYMHAWLSSGVVDSSRFYISRPDADSLVRYDWVKKYLVINMLTVSPWKFLDISFGNSMVYAGETPRAEAFIPFLFYKYLDRDLEKGGVADGNGSLFFDLLIRYPKNFGFYFTFYLDVIEIRKLLEGSGDNTWFAFTIGNKSTDLLVNNLDFSVEYTRINPWVYEHKDEVTTYKHLYDYPLGNWMGQNSDMLRLQFEYKFIRSLKFKIWYEYIRKGGTDKTYTDYNSESRNAPFMYGQKRIENNMGLNIRYNPYHDVFATFNYEFKNISDDAENRTLEYLLGKNHFISVGLQYGL